MGPDFNPLPLTGEWHREMALTDGLSQRGSCRGALAEGLSRETLAPGNGSHGRALADGLSQRGSCRGALVEGLSRRGFSQESWLSQSGRWFSWSGRWLSRTGSRGSWEMALVDRFLRTGSRGSWEMHGSHGQALADRKRWQVCALGHIISYNNIYIYIYIYIYICMYVYIPKYDKI